MAVRNADLIRGILNGGHLQFKMGSEWVDCGGDAQAWLSVVICGGGAEPGHFRIRPGSEKPYNAAPAPDLRGVLTVLERLLPQHKNDSMRNQIETAIAQLRTSDGVTTPVAEQEQTLAFLLKRCARCLPPDHATRKLATDYLKEQGFFNVLRASGVQLKGK